MPNISQWQIVSASVRACVCADCMLWMQWQSSSSSSHREEKKTSFLLHQSIRCWVLSIKILLWVIWINDLHFFHFKWTEIFSSHLGSHAHSLHSQRTHTYRSNWQNSLRFNCFRSIFFYSTLIHKCDLNLFHDSWFNLFQFTIKFSTFRVVVVVVVVVVVAILFCRHRCRLFCFYIPIISFSLSFSSCYSTVEQNKLGSDLDLRVECC